MTHLTGDARKRQAEATESAHTADHGRCQHIWRVVPPDGMAEAYWRCDSCGATQDDPLELDGPADHGRAGLSEDEREAIRVAWRGPWGDELVPNAPERMVTAVEAILAARMADAQKIAAFGYRFWPRVKVGTPSECWPWTGGTVGTGHGMVDGSPAGYTAHRYAWATANGRLPTTDEVVRHKCDNPPCCNPRHLLIGTQADNVDDMIDRGRAAYTRTHCAKGHERTPENTLTRTDGTQRCLPCQRESDKARREREGRHRCFMCDQYEGEFANLSRHLAAKHGTPLKSQELRDRLARADQYDGGKP